MRPFEEMERWFEDAFHRQTLFPAWMPRIKFPELGEISPSVDIFEEKGDVVVKAEVPGISKENIEVSVAGDVITISGEKKGEEKVERKDFHYHERSFGSFTRRFRLPPGTQTDRAKASFKDGVLMIRIPKSAAAAEKSKKIKVD
ncbi:MAG: Hsp20/alpha crystallin family protein [Geobacter sp.]|nr:Hsp20/alpha crystallin family protein [Geobacter sp.]